MPSIFKNELLIYDEWVQECMSEWNGPQSDRFPDNVWELKPFPIPRWMDESERRVWELPLNALLAWDTNQKRNEIGNCATSGKNRSFELVEGIWLFFQEEGITECISQN